MVKKDTGFGRSSHPIHPDGRVLSGNKFAIPAGIKQVGYIAKRVSRGPLK